VLFVTSQPVSAQAGRFVQMLAENNLQVDVIGPGQIPTDLQSLEAFRVIFLHNLLSSEISQEQMVALDVFVSRLAGGLVFLGGRSSYTLGGYSGTLIEPMLPVQLEPPPRSERPPIVFLLVLDRSASMGTSSEEEGPRPIDLAREAAMRAIEAMQPQDYLGVISFNDEHSWDVTLRQLGSGLTLREALDAVSQVRASGSTYMFTALLEALAGMQNLQANIRPEGEVSAPSARHMLVLSDGQSYDGSPLSFQDLAEAARAQGITLSTIAFGEDADAETMQILAEAGDGRFYQVNEADELPRILIYESQAARSENVQAGQTSLQPGETGHPVLSGLRLDQFPALSGYNALSSKAEAGAEDVLVSSNFRDPVLSAWQYGLGRVVAWTSDLGEEWTGEWPGKGPAGSEGQFWSQVVRYALVNPALGTAQVHVQVEPVRLVVEAALMDLAGDPLDLARVSFTYAGPDGQAHTFALTQSSAGIYGVELPRPPEGAYRAFLAYTDEDGQIKEVPAPFAVDPPAEWLPVNTELGQGNLARWASAAGGKVLLAPGQELEPAAPGPEQTGGSPWQRWLLLALLLLWPLEIAIRRRWMPWR
jgi:Mg-chelatase subunit ChlD